MSNIYSKVPKGIIPISAGLLLIIILNTSSGRTVLDADSPLFQHDDYLDRFTKEYFDKREGRSLSDHYYEYRKLTSLIEKENRYRNWKERERQRRAELEKKRKLAEQEKREKEDQARIEWLTYEITAYTAGYESTQKKKGEHGYGITASGVPVQEGVTLACPKHIPFGTKIEIEGIGVRVCQDRGGAITDGKLDLYMSDLNKAIQFGRQKRKIRIIE